MDGSRDVVPKGILVTYFGLYVDLLTTANDSLLRSNLLFINLFFFLYLKKTWVLQMLCIIFLVCDLWFVEANASRRGLDELLELARISDFGPKAQFYIRQAIEGTQIL